MPVDTLVVVLVDLVDVEVEDFVEVVFGFSLEFSLLILILISALTLANSSLVLRLSSACFSIFSISKLFSILTSKASI